MIDVESRQNHVECRRPRLLPGHPVRLGEETAL
jgi:hypothetical protein